jgi:prephenate dehydratase
MKIGFQGHKGAYSELALREYFGESSEAFGFDISELVLENLLNGKLDIGFLPIENSIVGNVAVNLDLLNNHETNIIGEFYLNINHCLLVKPGTKITSIKHAHSHPIALAQCRGFLQKHQIDSVSALDTAGSALKLSKQDKSDHAVIASSLCSKYYGLEILKENIQTVENNITRFVAFVKKENTPKDLVQEKTSLSFSTNHEAGALLKCMQVFSNHKINLTKIESRPVPTDPFHYIFYVDFIGAINDSEISKCLEELDEHVQYVNVLGSYPIAQKPS